MDLLQSCAKPSLYMLVDGDYAVCVNPDSKVHGANMGPTWVLSAPDEPHVGPMNLAIRDGLMPLSKARKPRRALITKNDNVLYNYSGIFSSRIKKLDWYWSYKIGKIFTLFKQGNSKLCHRCIPLTNLPLDKIAAISQTAFSNTFWWMKSFVFLFKFHWNLFPGV